MAKKTKRKSGYGDTHITRHIITNWESYEVKKEELDSLEKGYQGNLLLDFGFVTVSGSISFLIAWSQVNINENKMLYHIYLLVWIVLGIISVILLALWFSNRNKYKATFQEIRNRQSRED